MKIAADLCAATSGVMRRGRRTLQRKGLSQSEDWFGERTDHGNDGKNVKNGMYGFGACRVGLATDQWL